MHGTCWVAAIRGSRFSSKCACWGLKPSVHQAEKCHASTCWPTYGPVQDLSRSKREKSLYKDRSMISRISGQPAYWRRARDLHSLRWPPMISNSLKREYARACLLIRRDVSPALHVLMRCGGVYFTKSSLEAALPPVSWRHADPPSFTILGMIDNRSK